MSAENRPGTGTGAAVVGLLWAQSTAGVIGRDGTLPWHLPEDLRHFKRTTLGHPVVMGRRTWESFPAKFRPLPERTNIVLSRDEHWHDDGAVRAGTLAQALDLAAASPGGEEIWIIGGGQLFTEALAVANTAVVTTIDADPAGDTYAPELDSSWELAESLPSQGWETSANGTRYRIETWRLK